VQNFDRKAEKISKIRPSEENQKNAEISDNLATLVIKYV
jgi:hypothetical protein